MKPSVWIKTRQDDAALFDVILFSIVGDRTAYTGLTPYQVKGVVTSGPKYAAIEFLDHEEHLIRDSGEVERILRDRGGLTFHDAGACPTCNSTGAIADGGPCPSCSQSWTPPG